MRQALLIINVAIIAFLIAFLIIGLFKPKAEVYEEYLPEEEVTSER